jgi:hypothetical protein
MGDIGDIWRDYRKYILPHICETRQRRFEKFHLKFPDLVNRLRDVGIELRSLNQGEHIQMRAGKLIANYYPRTRSYFIQQPKLSDTDRIGFEEAIARFLRQASKISGTVSSIYLETQRLEAESHGIGPKIVDIDDQILKYLSKHPEYVYDLSSQKFEELVGRILTDFGFEIELTKRTRDGGRDIIAYIRNEVCKLLVFVECKQYAFDHPVGVEVVRSVYGVQRAHRANKSLVVTTSYFTEVAKQFQRVIEWECELRDYQDLKNWLSRYGS